MPDSRTTAVVFVAPDLDSVLKPTNAAGAKDAGWRQEIQDGQVSVGAFKEVIAKRWRRREGNEPDPVVEGAQDREIQEWPKPSRG